MMKKDIYQNDMKEVNRRTFIKLATTLVTGVVTGELMIPMGRTVNSAVEKVTGLRTGDVVTYQKTETSCKSAATSQKCSQSYKSSLAEKIFGVVYAPPLEELVSRGIPSVMVSASEKRKTPILDIFTGTRNLKMTRRELLVGVTSSILFGASHNITANGFDTQTIPASQALAGMVFWYLQRKIGIVANTAAHAWYNFRVMT